MQAALAGGKLGAKTTRQTASNQKGPEESKAEAWDEYYYAEGEGEEEEAADQDPEVNAGTDVEQEASIPGSW